MLTPVLKPNDQKAYKLIGIVSVIVFLAVVVLSKYNLAGQVQMPFDVHIFATISALVNGTVACLLVAGLFAVKQKNFQLHKTIMLFAIGLSVIFLVSYIGHHLFAGETSYGETDGIKGLSDAEGAAAGTMRSVYLAILFTHIPLAGLSLPFILLAAYRGLTGEYAKHKKLVRLIWPVWFYVAVSGVVIYLMVSPYYS